HLLPLTSSRDHKNRLMADIQVALCYTLCTVLKHDLNLCCKYHAMPTAMVLKLSTIIL
nr:hypothetical protein [Tanacetum cinerariifolium]GFB40638.1 hypothetical protein [Tanacetum cinerariifolium]